MRYDNGHAWANLITYFTEDVTGDHLGVVGYALSVVAVLVPVGLVAEHRIPTGPLRVIPRIGRVPLATLFVLATTYAYFGFAMSRMDAVGSWIPFIGFVAYTPIVLLTPLALAVYVVWCHRAGGSFVAASTRGRRVLIFVPVAGLLIAWSQLYARRSELHTGPRYVDNEYFHGLMQSWLFNVPADTVWGFALLMAHPAAVVCFVVLGLVSVAAPRKAAHPLGAASSIVHAVAGVAVVVATVVGALVAALVAFAFCVFALIVLFAYFFFAAIIACFATPVVVVIIRK